MRDLLGEIKTLMPMEGANEVFVKRSSNFGAVALVKIDRDVELDLKLIPRPALGKGEGKILPL